MSDTIPTPAEGAGTPAPAAAPTAESQVNWQNEAESYKRRFNGLQGTFQKTQDELERIKAAKFDLEQKLTAITGDHAAADIERKSLAEKFQAAETEAKALRAKTDRLQVLATDYRDLLDFETKGLLPDGHGDELKTKLTAFREALTSRGQEAVAKLTTGATPPAPPQTVPTAPRDLLKLAQEAFGKGDMTGYTNYYNQYVTTSNKKGS